MITEVVVGGPPEDWHLYEVYKDGRMLTDVVEVDTERGWARRLNLHDPLPEGAKEVPTYEDRGNFEIRKGDLK